MNQPIDAIYDNGVLRPSVPLSLPDKTRVKVIVELQLPTNSVTPPQDEWERKLLGLVKDCGVSLANSAVGSEGLYE